MKKTNHMILKEKDLCTGCSACMQICPNDSIHMCDDEEGFLYPIKNTETCINCGACEKVCPVLNISPHTEEYMSCKIACAKDYDLLEKSSSGGIFGLLAISIIENSGVVFGVAFDEEFQAHHIVIEKREELHLIQKSKYLQSNKENSFRLVRKYLKEGKQVLYSGTACEIAGLKAYLRGNDDNLLTVDVLCHGVPSPKVWKRYLNKVCEINKCNVDNIDFRCKGDGWRKYSIEFILKNGEKLNIYHKNDEYMRLFLNNICLRPSCYDCKFKKLERDSDVSLGDAWGIEKVFPDFEAEKGASVIIVHSEKGEKMIKQIQEQLITEMCEVDEILKPSDDARKSVYMHPSRKKFFRLLKKRKSWEKLVGALKLTVPDRINLKIRMICRRK